MFEKKTNPWMISTLLLAGIFVGVGLSQGYQLINNLIDKPTVNAPTTANDTTTTKKNDFKAINYKKIDTAMDENKDAVLGSSDAPVTIVEYSDYQCPYCSRFHSGAYQGLVSEYISTGKVKLIFKDFPLSFHPQAQKASEAANCTLEQDTMKYWQMHDMLFTRNAEWAGKENASEIFKSFASDLGLDKGDFETCLDSGKYADEVTQDIAEGRIDSVSGTPSFLINGQQIVGAQPFEAFKKIIEAELAK